MTDCTPTASVRALFPGTLAAHVAAAAPGVSIVLRLVRRAATHGGITLRYANRIGDLRRDMEAERMVLEGVT